MQLSIGNAPCSWGVEFADDPRNPPWTRVLDERRPPAIPASSWTFGLHAGGSAVLGPALAERNLTLIGGVLFRPFHDPAQWPQVKDAALRTCRTLTHTRQATGVDHSISPRARRPPAAAPRRHARGSEREGFLTGMDGRQARREIRPRGHHATRTRPIRSIRGQLETVLDAIEPALLACASTRVTANMRASIQWTFIAGMRSASRTHFRNRSAHRRRAIDERIGFYDACAAGLFCNLARHR